jgi:PTH1 family peptidyl-tRNA hydrolase
LKFLIAGLGNPGEEYAGTRHNIGFMTLDALSRASNVAFIPGRLASVAKGKYRGRTLVMIQPSTFMNLSGRAVHYWLQAEKIPSQNLLVITDDIALPTGAIRIRSKGSDGGHNGLKSISESLNTEAYSRLRFGIGNDFPKGGQSDYVLGKWKEEELPLVTERINKAVEAIHCFVTEGIANAMNKFNSK